jgi:8-oxo-dGTP pyrophosphatase MutT (NUDIX family)
MTGQKTPAELKALKAIEDKALMRAAGAVSKAFLSGNAASMTQAQRMPGTSWSNQGGLSNQLLARVSENLAQSFGRAPEELEAALAEQGMSWGPPFPPGRPLDPFWGYKRPPRTRDFSVGENVQITPRWNRVSFNTLDQLWKQYDVAQICTQHLLNDVRSLDYHFEAVQGMREDVAEDIVAARTFFESPDKRQPFRAWLAEYLMDVIKFDAGCLYIRRNNGGDPIALEVVDGRTIIPLADFYGRPATDEDDTDPELSPAGLFEGDLTPAYLQIIQGMPWDWIVFDDMIYQPWYPQPDSMYGRAPLEAVLLSANTDMRFQWHFLQYFTEGTLPVGFMEAPPDLSDPSQIREWQDTWDAFMLGDQSKLRQIRWVPAGARFVPAKEHADKFDDQFPLYLMRRVCASFGVTPADLGFTETVNKATSETQVDIQFRVGTLPLVRHVEDVINLFISEDLKLRVRLRFDTGREIEDRLATAQAEKTYIDAGVLSPDEPRARLGYPIDLNNPTPRFINNPRQGPIPVLAVQSVAGATDPETYAPAKGTPLIDHPFIPPPGPAPVMGSPEQKAADAASAEMQRNMIAQATGKKRGETASDKAFAAAHAPKPSTAAAAAQAAEKAVDDFYAQLAKDSPAGGPGPLGGAPSNLGGPGVTGGVGQGGIYASTGVYGRDLGKDEEGDEDEDDATKALAITVSLRRWRENARNRLRKGLAPRRFVDPEMPGILSDAVWERLEGASTREAIDKAFIDPLGNAAKAAGVGKAKAKPVRAAGIAVVAKDSGRVVMIQRDNDDPEKKSSGKWEFPGGRLDDGEDPWDAAKREWEEETGISLPKGERSNQWTYKDYVGFVYVIPKEDALTLNPDKAARDVIDPDHPRDEQGEVVAWWEPKDAEGNEAMRKEFKKFDWALVTKAY